MTAAIHLAGPEQAALCHGLVAQYHAEANLPYDEAYRAAVVDPLLEGSPLGAMWLLGPARAPLGYVTVTFTWSIAAGGMTGQVREMFIRDKVRRRGIGTESIHALAVALRGAGVKALDVDLAQEDQRSFWFKAGFKQESQVLTLTDVL